VPAATRDSFTGHPIDLELGLIDMGGRHYHGGFHRFLQPDSVVQAPLYGPSWNRYAYVFNNPLKYTDPTGHMAAVTEPRPLNEDACGVLCNGGGFGVGMGAVGLDGRGEPVAAETTAPVDAASTTTGSAWDGRPLYAQAGPDPSAPPPTTLSEGTYWAPSEETVVHEKTPPAPPPPPPPPSWITSTAHLPRTQLITLRTTVEQKRLVYANSRNSEQNAFGALIGSVVLGVVSLALPPEAVVLSKVLGNTSVLGSMGSVVALLNARNTTTAARTDLLNYQLVVDSTLNDLDLGPFRPWADSFVYPLGKGLPEFDSRATDFEREGLGGLGGLD
jgi:RHS repeat-associated protein